MVRRTRVVYAAAALAAAALVFVGGFIVARSTEGRGPNGAPAAPDGRSEQ